MNERDDYIGKLFALNREELATIAWDLLQRKNDLRAQLAEVEEKNKTQAQLIWNCRKDKDICARELKKVQESFERDIEWRDKKLAKFDEILLELEAELKQARECIAELEEKPMKK